MLRDTPYNVSKAVMNMISVQLAAQLEEREIAVMAFHPGWVRTDMGGERADISPEESASAIVETVAGMGMEQSGGFYRHDGTPHPW